MLDNELLDCLRRTTNSPVTLDMGDPGSDLGVVNPYAPLQTALLTKLDTEVGSKA